MKNLLYDYKKNDFKIENKSGNKIYYLRIKDEYIEVDEKIYKICKASYNKLYYTYQQEVAKSVLHYGDIDLAASFSLPDNKNIIDKLWLKDVVNAIYQEIDLLDDLDKKIAIEAFIYEYSDTQIAKHLHLTRQAITYRKKKIQKLLQKKLKKLLHFDE